MRLIPLAMLLNCCITGPDYPVIRPDPSWQAEYDWTWRTCGIKNGRAARVHWDQLHFQVVPGSGDRFWVEGYEAHGAYHVSSRTILLSEEMVKDTPMASWVRRHEFLHAQTGLPGHPPLFEACQRWYVLTLSTLRNGSEDGQ